MPIEEITLPPARIVAGNPALAQNKTDFHTGENIIDKTTGLVVQEWRCEIAIPKDQFNDLYGKMVQEVGSMYPIGADGQPVVDRDFAWKFVDGDSPAIPKKSKTPYNVREGFPGHYVLKISTQAFAPPVFKKGDNGTYRQMDASEIKTGDYVAANVTIKVHNNSDGGIYINPNAFEFVAYGPAISGIGGANPDEMFKGQQYQLPVGASLTPLASNTPLPAAPLAAAPLAAAPLAAAPLAAAPLAAAGMPTLPPAR